MEKKWKLAPEQRYYNSSSGGRARVNPDVTGSNPALVNFPLFNQKFEFIKDL